VALTAYAVSLTVTAVLACIFLGAVLDGDIFILIPASIVAFVIDTDTFVTGKNIAAGIVVTCQNVIITTFIFTMVWTFTAFTVLVYSEAICGIAGVARVISFIVDSIRAVAAVVLHLFITNK
jgi:hypothetical protein